MEKDDLLSKAIADYLVEKGMLNAGEAVGDFIVMVEINSFTEEGKGKTWYGNIVPNEGSMPLHRALGLIEVCTGLFDE